MAGKGHYEYPAWSQMEDALDTYEKDRATYLEREANNLGPDARQQLDRFNQAADSLVKGVQELTGVNAIDCLLGLAKLADPPRFFKLLEEHVCICFGWEALGMLSTARGRFLRLLLMLRDRQPSDSAKAFLQHVGRCYLFGFDTECVVMCRAVLDREFEERIIDDDHISEWWKWYSTTPEGRKCKGKRPPYGKLWARIQAAKYARLIEEDDRVAADAVRNRGNDAVHKKPSEREALEGVRQTVRVLDALEKSRFAKCR